MMIRQTTFLILIFVMCVVLMLINNIAPLSRSKPSTLLLSSPPVTAKERLALPNFTADLLVRESARDDRWFGLQSTFLSFNSDAQYASTVANNNRTAMQATMNRRTEVRSLPAYIPVEVAVIVPHLIVKTRDVHRQYWMNFGRDLHMFAINTSDETIQHVPSGDRWTRYAMYLQHNSQTDSVASAFRQARQFADYFMILSYVQRSNCFDAPYIMLVDDDVRPCNCLTDYMRRILDWLQSSVREWRIARFSIGTNGLLLQCSHLPHLLHMLEHRWRYAQDFTFAIDYEMSLWAMPYPSAPIKESLEFTSRFTLFRHELHGESTLWNGEHIVARSIPQCFDPIVWVVGGIDRSVFYEWSSFDAVRCQQYIVSPCTRSDTPRRPRNVADLHALRCNAPDRYALVNASVSRSVSSMHVLIARAGESCTNRCARAERRCDAEAAFVLADIELYAKRSDARPLQCLLTMSHTHLLGAHVALRNVALDRPPLCNVESLVDDELGSTLFSCDSRPAKTDLRLRLCPCATLLSPSDDHKSSDVVQQRQQQEMTEAAAMEETEKTEHRNASCEKGYEMRYGRCAPCALGEYGGGGNASCEQCPLDRLRSRAYFARIAARTVDECAVSCTYGDDASRTGRCPSISRSSLAKTMSLFFVYLTVLIWLSTDRCLLFVELIKRV